MRNAFSWTAGSLFKCWSHFFFCDQDRVHTNGKHPWEGSSRRAQTHRMGSLHTVYSPSHSRHCRKSTEQRKVCRGERHLVTGHIKVVTTQRPPPTSHNRHCKKNAEQRKLCRGQRHLVTGHIKVIITQRPPPLPLWKRVCRRSLSSAWELADPSSHLALKPQLARFHFR